MSLQVNYEDDFFYLATCIKSLNAALSLELDPEFFAAHLDQNVEFISSTLERIGLRLESHGMVHGKTNHVRALLRTQRSFIECLELLINGEGPLAAALEHQRMRYSEMLREHKHSLSVVQNTLDQLINARTEEETISEAEYRVLLDPENEETL